MVVSGSDLRLRVQRQSKSCRSEPTDRVNETKNGFKSRRFFTLLVLVLLIVIEILL
jgi:hypothetical protein